MKFEFPFFGLINLRFFNGNLILTANYTFLSENCSFRAKSVPLYLQSRLRIINSDQGPLDLLL
jgi:hypothetical protein